LTHVVPFLIEDELKRIPPAAVAPLIEAAEAAFLKDQRETGGGVWASMKTAQPPNEEQPDKTC
jgi:hypothetical protein